MELIETIELSSPAASLEFTGIDTTTGDDLLLVISVRSDSVSTEDIIGVRVNGAIATSRYAYKGIGGSGTSASVWNGSSNYALWGHYMPAQYMSTSTFGSMRYYFKNFRSSSAKWVSIDSVSENASSTSYQFAAAGKVDDTTPISSLMVWSFNSANLSQYTKASLYKITKA